MSNYISDIKDGLKQILTLYPLKTSLKSIAYTANFADLTGTPTKPFYEQLDTPILNFSGSLLATNSNGGTINFHYRNSGTVTSSIIEYSGGLKVNSETTTLSGNLVTSGYLNVGSYATINGITLSLSNNQLNISHGVRINGGTAVIASDGAISGTKISGTTLTMSGAATVYSMSATNGIVTSTLTASGNITSKTKVTAPIFEGNATSANWADLAEKYESDKDYPFGTLIQFGGEKEVTVAQTEVNGVVSEKAGYLLNASSSGLPIALCGRVKVLVNGVVNKFDKLTLDKNGVARKATDGETVIARALENKKAEEIGLVLCATQFRL